MEKIKINWRNEYLIDNIFHTIICLMCILIIAFKVEPLFLLIPLGTQLLITTSVFGFFNKEKYK